jgi:hypothetical protein
MEAPPLSGHKRSDTNPRIGDEKKMGEEYGKSYLTEAQSEEL